MEKKSIGAFMSALRKANGYTQEEVAEYLGVSNKTISSWECDKSAPDLSLLPLLAEFYHVTCDELIRGERQTKAETPLPRDSEKRVRELLRRQAEKLDFIRLLVLGIYAFGILIMYAVGYGLFNGIVGFLLGVLFTFGGTLFAALYGKYIRAKTLSEEYIAVQESFLAAWARYKRLVAFACAEALALVLPQAIGASAYSVISFDSYLRIVAVIEGVYLVVLGIYAVIRGVKADNPAREKRKRILKRMSVITVCLLVCTALFGAGAFGVAVAFSERTEYESYEAFLKAIQTPSYQWGTLQKSEFGYVKYVILYEVDPFYMDWDSNPERYEWLETDESITITYLDSGDPWSVTYEKSTIVVGDEEYSYAYINQNIAEWSVELKDGVPVFWTMDCETIVRNQMRIDNAVLITAEVCGLEFAVCVIVFAVLFVKAGRGKKKSV